MNGIDPHKLALLINKPPKELHDEVVTKVISCLDLVAKEYPAHADALRMPEIVYDLRGTTAGTANADRIRVNLELLLDPKSQTNMLLDTVPHEAAHVITRQIWPNDHDHHGPLWAHVMGILGVPAVRCHNYDLSNVTVRKRARPFEYRCSCQTHMVTATLHRRMQQGRTYTCTDCGGQLRKVANY